MTEVSFTEYLRLIITSLFIMLGWYVLYNNSQKIETRKEIRKLADTIVDLIDEIGDDVESYYSVQNLNHISFLSEDIKAKLSLISHYLFILQNCNVRFRGSESLTNFRKTATGGHFETETFKQQLDIPGWKSELSASKAQLRLSVDQAYFSWTGAYNIEKKSIKKMAPWLVK